MKQLIEITGNLLTPHKFDVIAHQTNCNNVFGAGIAAQIKKICPEAWDLDCDFAQNKRNYLGNVGITFCQDIGAYVANCYAQHLNSGNKQNGRKTDYEAFYSCMEKLRAWCDAERSNSTSLSIAFPENIGCALGGGNWRIIRTVIEEVFNGYEGDVYIVRWDGTIL